MTEIQLSRKQRERQIRKEEILDAARQVFSQRGFEKATLEEIAEIAEYGKGTIYNYFSSKEDLFVSVIIRGIHRFRTFVEKAIEGRQTPRDKLEAYIDASFEFFEQHRQLFSILQTERNKLAQSLNDDMFHRFCEEEKNLTGYLAQFLKEGISAGEFKPIDAQKLAQVLFGMIHVAIIHDVREPDEYNLQSEAEFIKQIFFEGIAQNRVIHE